MHSSIIIPTWNGLPWIGDCLRAIEENRPDEIIVVDNGSTDATSDLVARDFPHVRLIRLRRNLGFAAAVNHGLRVAHGDVLILINQDVVVHAGCLDALTERLTASGPAIVGCKLLYPDGKTLQHAGGIIVYPRAEPNHRGYRQVDDGRWDTLTPVDYVTGAVFAFDRAVFERVGEFDEAFAPAYYEEVDYCYRARAAGLAVLYEPRAVAIHHESQSSDRDSVIYHRAMQRGRLRFVLKHMLADQISDEFEPAERTHLFSVTLAYRRQVFAHAYMHALLSVADVYALRTPTGESALKVSASLARLQQAALSSVAHERENKMDDRSQLFQTPVLQEFQFQSRLPLIGRMRRGLYALASKWAVRYLMQQQNQINQALAQTLREYVDRLEEYDLRLIDQDRDLVYLTRTVAELELRQRQLLKRMHTPEVAAQTHDQS